jgi:hypothetical protein
MGVDDHGHGVSVKGMKRGERCREGDETVVRQVHGPWTKYTAHFPASSTGNLTLPLQQGHDRAAKVHASDSWAQKFARFVCRFEAARAYPDPRHVFQAIPSTTRSTLSSFPTTSSQRQHWVARAIIQPQFNAKRRCWTMSSKDTSCC